MTPFVKESFARALSAALWCVPGGLWWASPMWAGETPADSSWIVVLPQDGFICGNAFSGYKWSRTHALRAAMARGEYTDSLISIAGNAQKSASVRGSARRGLARLGDPRALRYLAAQPPVLELPPLVVRPAP